MALSRPAASAAVEAAGWRLLLGSFAASIPVSGLRQAVDVSNVVITACGKLADDHLRIDLRPTRIELALRRRDALGVTDLDVELAVGITDAVRDLGLALAAPTGDRPVQMFEVAIDALDIAAIRPFWKAVLAYTDEAGAGPEDAIVDPAGQLPSLWFQQMDAPRPQRNRIHFDLDVAHDEAPARLQAALDAGGVLVSDARAPAFWVLADTEGNEICICTWQGRD